MTSDDVPARADVVVIGGGVVGSSVAYHLAAEGVGDVLLLERAKLGSGTSWHAAGNMETYRSHPLMMAMVRYATELFPLLEAESGVSFGWRQPGRVLYTTDPGWLEHYRATPPQSRRAGVDSHFLGPEEVMERLPIMASDGILGGLWVPSDGRVDPTNLATAFARAAAKRGARAIEDVAVTRIIAESGRVTGVETAAGTVRTEHVVLAAGLWSPTIAATCGVMLPQMALEHLYLLTLPIPGLPRDLPLFLSYDEQTYGREDVGGLLVGWLDEAAIPVEPEDLPADFAFGLLPERWGQIERYLAPTMRRFPAMEQAGVRMLLNGPESFTPDGRMLLGAVPELSGLYLATAMNSNGIALSSCVGKIVAEWIAHGRPSLDVSPLGLARFGAEQRTRSYLRARIPEVPSAMCKLPDPSAANEG